MIVSLASALFSIFGLALAIYPDWLQENCNVRFSYGYSHIIVILILLYSPGYVASCVRGFQTPFELFDGEGHFPYYKITYYGAVGQAAFGVLVIEFCVIRLSYVTSAV